MIYDLLREDPIDRIAKYWILSQPSDQENKTDFAAE